MVPVDCESVAKPSLSHPTKPKLPECTTAPAKQSAVPTHDHPVRSPVSNPPFVMGVAFAAMGMESRPTTSNARTFDFMRRTRVQTLIQWNGLEIQGRCSEMSSHRLALFRAKSGPFELFRCLIQAGGTTMFSHRNLVRVMAVAMALTFVGSSALVVAAGQQAPV